jgi:hypothetical protein
MSVSNIDITEGGLRLLALTLHQREREPIYGRLVQQMVQLSLMFEVRLYMAFADLQSSHHMVLGSSSWTLLG